jgi:SpoVK/Ycf46/Vps4 family AAA+-type ATPase
MIGLTKVKAAVRGLMDLQIQNYEGELREERVKQISLHRVFTGNPGTGKTTVARLYGRLLKEFGFLSDGDLIEVKPSDLMGQAVGEASTRTAQLIETAKGKVLFIDEAYGLDPNRRGGGNGAASFNYGGSVLDTLVEKLDASAGSDMCVILAGYEHRMRDMFRNSGNEGLKRRFNLDEALKFEDFNDDELKTILLNMVAKEGLRTTSKAGTLAVKLVSQRRRLDDFGNAGEVSQILDRAKIKLSMRRQRHSEVTEKSDNNSRENLKEVRRGNIKDSDRNKYHVTNHTLAPEYFDIYELIESDFVSEETSAEKAREALSDLENVDHVVKLLEELEDTLTMATNEGKNVAEILDSAHMVFTGPPGTGKTTVAQRFGVMFKNLELLPRADVEIVTAANLISRYIGNTQHNVVEVMRKAKGGILFIDGRHRSNTCSQIMI